MDEVVISLNNLGVYFQNNTGKVISQLITLVVAVRLFSFFGDENLASSTEIEPTINIDIKKKKTLTPWKESDDQPR